MLNKITTNYYKVLELLYDNIMDVNKEQVSIITQIEVAEQLNLSKITVNSIFKELKEDGMLVDRSTVGRYFLTDNAKKIVETIKTLIL